MKIALIGYGKMGKMIEKVALNFGHDIVACINSQNSDWDNVEVADVCIEFSEPESALINLRRIAKLKKPAVIGTTGWYDKISEVETIVNEHNIGVLYSPNFSIGVQLINNMIAYASSLMNHFTEYDVASIEYHHNRKKDAPSGTALEIARIIEENIDRVEKLAISDVRCGSIPGTHTVLFDSPCDTITISHVARNRDGFATGAVFAAEWLVKKKGLYRFSDCFKDLAKV